MIFKSIQKREEKCVLMDLLHEDIKVKVTFLHLTKPHVMKMYPVLN